MQPFRTRTRLILAGLLFAAWAAHAQQPGQPTPPPRTFNTKPGRFNRFAKPPQDSVRNDSLNRLQGPNGSFNQQQAPNNSLNRGQAPVNPAQQLKPDSAGRAAPGIAGTAPSKSPPPSDSAAQKDTVKYINDTLYFDTFHFLGKQDDTLDILCQLSFQRTSKGGEDKKVTARFIGALGWKEFWYELEPLTDYPADVMERRAFPSHPAYDFKWPTDVEEGEIQYHYEQVFLSIVYNRLQPVFCAGSTSDHQSDFFISNAVLQGKSHVIKGILLYHRLRAIQPLKDELGYGISSYVSESAKKFCFLNAENGETYILWTHYPYPGSGPEKLAVRIDYKGGIHTSRRELDYRVTMVNNMISPALPSGWEFIIPEMQVTLDLREASHSPVLNQEKRIHKVKGTVKIKDMRQKLWGEIIDYLPVYARVPVPVSTAPPKETPPGKAPQKEKSWKKNWRDARQPPQQPPNRQAPPPPGQPPSNQQPNPPPQQQRAR